MKEKKMKLDGIQAILLQKLVNKGFATYYNFITSLHLNTFPDRWQIAIITLLLKPGKHLAFPRSYRPSVYSSIWENSSKN
jgi:hypothetical protein